MYVVRMDARLYVTVFVVSGTRTKLDRLEMIPDIVRPEDRELSSIPMPLLEMTVSSECCSSAARSTARLSNPLA